MTIEKKFSEFLIRIDEDALERIARERLGQEKLDQYPRHKGIYNACKDLENQLSLKTKKQIMVDY